MIIKEVKIMFSKVTTRVMDMIFIERYVRSNDPIINLLCAGALNVSSIALLF